MVLGKSNSYKMSRNLSVLNFLTMYDTAMGEVHLEIFVPLKLDQTSSPNSLAEDNLSILQCMASHHQMKNQQSLINFRCWDARFRFDACVRIP